VDAGVAIFPNQAALRVLTYRELALALNETRTGTLVGFSAVKRTFSPDFVLNATFVALLTTLCASNSTRFFICASRRLDPKHLILYRLSIVE
jgi:hypothetical protein